MPVGEVTRIKVSPEDQINHLVRKVSMASGQVVVLEVPLSAPVLVSEANLKLLKFYAERAGKKLYLSTEIPELISTGKKIELELYTPEKVLQDDTFVKSKSLRGFRPRWYHLLVIPVFLVALGLFVLYLPEPVQVVLELKERDFQEVIAVPLGNLDTSRIETEFIVSDQIASSGRVAQGISQAKGRIVLINDSDQPIEVPRGTSVSTAGDIKFSTLSGVKVPARQTEYFHEIPVGVKAGQAEVAVEAVMPGSSGNVAAGRIVKIAGFPGLKVVNPEPLSGGEERTLAVVTEDDLEALRQQLADLASERSQAELSLSTQEGLELLPSSVSWKFSEINLTPEAGEPSSSVVGKAVVTASGQVVSASRLIKQLVEDVLARLARSNEVLIDSLELESVELDQESGELICQVTGRAAARVSQEDLARMITGLEVSEASETLLALESIERVQIKSGDRLKMPPFKHYIQIQIATKTEVVPASGI